MSREVERGCGEQEKRIPLILFTLAQAPLIIHDRMRNRNNERMRERSNERMRNRNRMKYRNNESSITL